MHTGLWQFLNLKICSLLSTHMRNEPFFFITSTTLLAYGEWDFLIIPGCKSCSICSLTSLIMEGGIHLYFCLKGWSVKWISCFILLLWPMSSSFFKIYLCASLKNVEVSLSDFMLNVQLSLLLLFTCSFWILSGWISQSMAFGATGTVLVVTLGIWTLKVCYF